MSTIKSKAQLENIVILRAFAILSVVLYHSFCPWLYAWSCFDCECRPVYSFIFETVLVGRMPLFVSVSGYLFSHLLLDRGKYTSYPAFLKNKVVRLLFPALFFLFLSSVTAKTNLLNSILFNSDQWFLKMLFLCFLFAWPCLNYIKGKWQVLIGLVSIMISFLPEISFFCIGSFQKYFMFFYLGAMLYKYREKVSVISTKEGCTAIVILYAFLSIIALYLYYVDPNNYGDIIHTNKVLVLIRIVLRVLTVFMGFAIVNRFLTQRPDFKSQFLKKINSYSYGIYLTHLYVIGNIKDLRLYEPYKEWFTAHYLIAPVMVFIVVLTISIIVTKLFKSSKYTSWCIGG